MNRLSVMVLTRGDPQHRYFANALSGTGRVVAIVAESGMHWTARNVARTVRPDDLSRKIRGWLRDRGRGARKREVAFFFGDSEPVLSRAPRVLRVTSIDDPRVVQLAGELSPDLIAVFGTTMIRGELLDRAGSVLVNLHGGVAPRYRGTDSTFWALYNGEPEQIGCTLHFLDRGIDTGPLIAHVRPEVAGDDDDELTLFWRAIRDATAAFVELLGRMEQGERFGRPQPDKGRLYRFRDRRWRHDRELSQRLRGGMLRGVHLPPRVSWYTAS